MSSLAEKEQLSQQGVSLDSYIFLFWYLVRRFALSIIHLISFAKTTSVFVIEELFLSWQKYKTSFRCSVQLVCNSNQLHFRKLNASDNHWKQNQRSGFPQINGFLSMCWYLLELSESVVIPLNVQLPSLIVTNIPRVYNFLG